MVFSLRERAYKIIYANDVLKLEIPQKKRLRKPTKEKSGTPVRQSDKCQRKIEF